MKESDWHWLAGIWEGEGTVCITTQAQRRPFRKGIRLVVAISQKDVAMLNLIQELTGIGSIHPGHRAHIWVIASRSARLFLAQLLPFVRTQRRRKQIEGALARDAAARAAGKESLIASNRSRAAKR